MKKVFSYIILILTALPAFAQINDEQVLRVGRNALYFEDYMLSIQYFNRVIQAKPYLAQPYFYRAIAKVNLEDYIGAEADATTAVEINPYLTDAWEVRGVARQNLGNNAGAISDYNHALELLPRNRQMLFNKALAQLDLKDFNSADSTFAQLLRYYPGFDSGYLGRAQLNLARNDTTAAEADLNKALSINRNSANAYIMRADIAINRDSDLQAALADLNEAVKLMPRAAGLYINRAYIRYRLDDFFGAMADFDYSLELDPLNYTGLFNRGLLLMETGANDKALADFNRVIQLNPSDTRAYYNRAHINAEKGLYDDAISDINKVIEAYPGLPDAYYIRGDIYVRQKLFDNAEADYKKARKLANNLKPLEEQDVSSDERSTEEAARRFATMTTIENNVEIEEVYNNSAIRGRVQDRNLQIKYAGWMEIAYHTIGSELRPNTYYIKEVDDINATRILRFTIGVTPELPATNDEISTSHFKSIEYYNSYLANHSPRAIDYLGRALDFMTLRDYASALRDIDRALALTPNIAIGYYLRAQAAFHNWEIDQLKPSEKNIDAATRKSLSHKALDEVISDLKQVVSASPRMAEGWYNIAVVHLAMEDYTSALSALNKAIELKPEMGEAWYNRGYVYLRLGNERLGIADLSRAGELGILPAYNLIKRITK